jgi:hypothetical protein
MKIAVLAWGSLVWDRQSLAVTGNFEPTGPHLPIEFCRVSADWRLTLVIDEACGAYCATYVDVSPFGELLAAIENLRTREGMPNASAVGFVDLASGKQSARAIERHSKTVESIKAWTIANSYDAAIWTALGSNFAERDKANEAFSVEAAIRYVGRLDKLKFAKALHYVWNAPPEVQTPVRAAVKIHWPEV